MLPGRVGRRARRHPLPPARRRPIIGVLVAGLIALAAIPAAAQQTSKDPRAERDRIRSKRAEVATQVDALRAEDAEVDAALAALDENLRGKQAAFADADRAAGEAEREAAEAREAERQKEAEIERLREEIAGFAVAAYVNPPGEDLFDSFRAASAGEALQKRTLLDLRSGRDADLLDELRAARHELEELRERAERASEEARQRRAVAEQQLGEVQAARAQQAQFAAQVQQRLDARLGEAAALEETDRELSAEISRREAELAERLRRMSASPAAGGGSGGGPPIPVSGPIALANVRGIVVAASIAGQTEAMLAAAAADGIVLSGTGYRDISRQIELRRQHCGSSEYAIYQMPAEQCRPPTARPGASKHEQGLAIDFTEGGRTLSRSSAGFQWLAANAGRFGFVNLPSEPWHWSVGGG